MLLCYWREITATLYTSVADVICRSSSVIMSSSNPAEKSAKKLKQACLPFKLINSPGDEVNSKCRKRKLSGTENDDTRVENPKVELLNGGTKCFIKSDDVSTTNSELVSVFTLAIRLLSFIQIEHLIDTVHFPKLFNYYLLY